MPRMIVSRLKRFKTKLHKHSGRFFAACGAETVRRLVTVQWLAAGAIVARTSHRKRRTGYEQFGRAPRLLDKMIALRISARKLTMADQVGPLVFLTPNMQTKANVR